MNTVAMDRNTLNGLFDNQRKLDDLFDSIFDDENFFITATPSSSLSSSRSAAFDSESQSLYGRNANSSISAIKQNRFHYVIPIILEIAVIYLVVTNLL